MREEASPSSDSSSEGLLSLCGPEGSFCLPSMFQESHSGVLPMLVLLAGLLVRGTEFRIDLCHHLDDITLKGDAPNHN